MPWRASAACCAAHPVICCRLVLGQRAVVPLRSCQLQSSGGSLEPPLAEAVSAMLMQMEHDELHALLRSPEALNAKIIAALIQHLNLSV